MALPTDHPHGPAGTGAHRTTAAPAPTDARPVSEGPGTARGTTDLVLWVLLAAALALNAVLSIAGLPVPSLLAGLVVIGLGIALVRRRLARRSR